MHDSEVATRWLQYLAPHFAAFGKSAPQQLDLLYKSFDEQSEIVQLLLDTKPAVVSFHFGLPNTNRLKQLRSVGIRLVGTATNLHEAEALASAGLDAIVAQGIEAGGHRGVFDTTARDEKLSTLALTQLLVQRMSVPIIAAGGIMNGSAIAAMQAVGAEAAQLGTAFISSPESSADAAYRAALLTGDETETILTTAISGRPARGLANRFTALGEHPSCPSIPSYPLSYSVGKRLNAAATACGSADYGAHWAGQGVALLRPMGASKLVEVLASECREARTKLQLHH
jgi:nitronate monooxygenase